MIEKQTIRQLFKNKLPYEASLLEVQRDIGSGEIESVDALVTDIFRKILIQATDFDANDWAALDENEQREIVGMIKEVVEEVFPVVATAVIGSLKVDEESGSEELNQVDYSVPTEEYLNTIPEDYRDTIKNDLTAYLELHKILEFKVGSFGSRAEAIDRKIEEIRAILPKKGIMDFVIKWELLGLELTIISDLTAFIEGVLSRYQRGLPEVSSAEPIINKGMSEEELIRRYGNFREILTLPINDVINNLVTETYEANNMTNWRVAIEDRAKLEREKGGSFHSDLADMIETILLSYLFDIFKKGAAIDMDHVSINWEVASKKLSNEKGMQFYDSFRRNPLYEWAKIVALKADEIMGEKGRWYAAGGNWGNGTELMEEAVARLMGERSEDGNEDLIGFIEKVETDNPGEGPNIRNLITHIGHYETCLRDPRSTLAINALGNKRSAVKHRVGVTAAGSEQPQTILSKLSYKVGKNNDKGKYATALSWIDLPDDLFNAIVKKLENKVIKSGFNSLSDYEKEQLEVSKEHRRRFEIRYEESTSYFEYLFGSKEASDSFHSKKWKPKNWNSCFPQIDEALDYATTYWFEDTDTKGDFKRGRKASENEKRIFFKEEDDKTLEEKKIRLFRDNSLNFDHYEQTWGALNELYDMASTCWAKPIEHELAQMDEDSFVNRINLEIGKLGTQAAIALAYALALPDSDHKKGEIFESMRASMDAYIIYLLSQIEIEHGLTQSYGGFFLGDSGKNFINKEYENRYHEAQKEMITYIKNNSSLHQTYIHPVSGEKVKLSNSLIETIKDSAFKRKPHSDLRHSRQVYHNSRARRSGENHPEISLTREELTSEPKWQYGKESKTSVHEGEK